MIPVIAAIGFSYTPVRQQLYGYAADICVHSASVTSNFDEVYLNITCQAHSIILHNKISLAD